MNLPQLHSGMDVVSNRSLGVSVGSFTVLVRLVEESRVGGLVDGRDQKHILRRETRDE
jgi:hypothetical protein